MGFNKSYAFFLLITTIGAFLTIKICSAAYTAYDMSDEYPVPIHHVGPAVQKPLVDGLND